MHYNLLDIILVFLYVILAIMIARMHAKKKINDFSEYKYYTWGLFAKFFGGISVCLIYTFYYSGGDTVVYFNSAVALGKLLFVNPKAYFSILFGNLSAENYSMFSYATGWPTYFNDPQSFAVARFVSPFTILGFRSFLATTVLVAAFNYSGIWRLYRLFVEKFPEMKPQLAIAILFMPSLIFWGSGILKDSFTISAGGWFVYSYYRITMKRKNIFTSILMLIISSYVLIAIKPYIFFSLLIGLVVWYTADLVNKFKKPFFKVLVSPIIILMVWGLGSVLVMYFGTLVGGAYKDIDTLIEKAVVTQDDLKREYYQGNSFDIGVINPTIKGVLSKYPEAVTAGLFRPFIWESRNPVMFLAGVENLFLMVLLLFIIFSLGPIKILKATFKDSLLLSSLVFSLSFAFSIGLSTSNFGSLVRYKIPLIPFFVSYLFVVYYYNRKKVIYSD
ncbi:MAG: hypothetical protein GXO79_11405 [Chlorobi bacterium]|nr:hypothetical protein [Chlorobiota bacterium]